MKKLIAHHNFNIFVFCSRMPSPRIQDIAFRLIRNGEIIAEVPTHYKLMLKTGVLRGFM